MDEQRFDEEQKTVAEAETKTEEQEDEKPVRVRVGLRAGLAECSDIL